MTVLQSQIEVLQKPQITTAIMSEVTGISAVSGGTISASGLGEITERGVVWGTLSLPTIALATKTIDGTGTGSFTSTITGLTSATTYYARAYATNSAGTTYGAEVSFTTLTVVVLPSVTIGTQIWTTNNLNVTTYKNGDIIPEIQNATAWASLTTGAWCHYNNDPANDAIYGKLYNWYAVTDSRGLAPSGYHVPTDAEWTTLTTFLGGETVAGGKMKATTLWNSPNQDATNSSGFTGFPGGYRSSIGAFSNIGGIGLWWSSSELDTTYAWSRFLSYDLGFAFRSNTSKKNGFSVRCLKD
jgi:uncharacterized protein (TIGR02145 family)